MLNLAMQWKLAIFWLLLITACLCARWRGGLPEKQAALSLLVAALLTIAYRSNAAVRYSSLDIGVVLIDVGLLSALAIIAVRADRGWPIPLAALQAITVLGHFCKLVNPDLWRLGYALITTAPAYPGLVILLVGIYRHRHREQRAAAGAC